jgi:glutamyl-Q tRNA(Asp) synthetase
MASYLDAKAHNGQWLLRIENLDPPREQPGSADAILRTLEALGFTWDGPVLWQSERFDCYNDILQQLLQQGLAYACRCSRKQLNINPIMGIEGPIYPGYCRHLGLNPAPGLAACRVRTHDRPIGFCDRIQGPIEQRLASELGDFVIFRADGFFAYQLASVIDDAYQGINQVVRGADLLQSTSRQIHLQQLLGYPLPGYAHIPQALDAKGQKLGKSTQAPAIDPQAPMPALRQAWAFLGQGQAPLDLDLNDFWPWAIGQWSMEQVPRCLARAHPQFL